MEKWLGQDPAPVVIDELAGMWISVVLVPPAPLNAAAAFLLFRFFDIVKPPPARQFDRLHGGTGIMMDDVAAGIYANIVLQLFLLLIR
jgi:phosphatidylglycerophosphatase A